MFGLEVLFWWILILSVLFLLFWFLCWQGGVEAEADAVVLMVSWEDGYNAGVEAMRVGMVNALSEGDDGDDINEAVRDVAEAWGLLNGELGKSVKGLLDGAELDLLLGVDEAVSVLVTRCGGCSDVDGGVDE